LTWTTERYNRPPLYVTENGMDDESGEKPLEEMLQDTKRIRYYQEYLTAVLQAMRYDPNAHVSSFLQSLNCFWSSTMLQLGCPR
jgi:beta-glucosidase/6-phospho-beta-glucosidase/beta-galactosidase